MKKIIISLIFIFILVLTLSISCSTFASGSITPSSRNLSIKKGETSSFKITASNACGRVDISSSDNSIAKVDTSSLWLENDSVTVTVTGVSVGNATITVRLSDAATFDEEELSESYTINVIINEPQQETHSNINNNSSNTSNRNNNKKTEDKNLSKNNNLKTISIEGYELKNTEGNIYELEVMNNVSKININAIAEDLKSTISGNGEKELQVGLNTFEIIVKSELGSTNTYIVKVTRKDAYYLEDLNNILTDEAITNPEIIINRDTLVTTEQLEQIKKSKKEVTLKLKDKENNIIYFWKLDGNKINSIEEFKTGISFTSENISKIEKISNYANGIILNFEHTGNLPIGTKVKIYVGNEYKDGENINIYFYNANKEEMNLIEKNLIVEDGYIEFEINHCSEYFITRAVINNKIKQDNDINIYMILFVISVVLLLIVITLDIFKLNPILRINNK